ncbi:MAG: tetratricopeptide (TPR) repeat protein [Planctomycetota bacterium]
MNAETREAAGELHASVLAESNAAAIKTASDLRDSVMLERLETLRIPLLDQQREGEDFQGNRGRYGRPSDSVWRERELRRIGEDYALAFAEYLGGPSLLTQETEQALLALRSGEIEPALGTALDHWVLARESLKDLGDAPDAAGTQQVRELASALDTSDPWRTQLRDVMSHADGQASKLLALAEQLDLPSLTVSGCRVLAEALSRAGERDAAIRVLQRGRRQHPGSFDLCLSLAMAFQRSSTPDHEAALDLYRVAHALRPDIDQLIRLEGRALQTLGRAGEAQELYRSESQRQPDNSIWLFEIGRILNLQGKQREGMDTLKAALARDPRSIESRILLGDIFRNREEFQAAVVHFRLGLEVDPANIDLTIRLAWACSELGELDEAIENYETYLASNPRDAQNLTNLASALWLQGKISESAIYFEQAIEVNPDYVPALTGLGANPNRRGTDGSKKLLGKAIELNPLHAPAHLHMASQFTMDGRYGEALTYYRQALELWAPLRDPFSVRWAGQTRIILDDCLYQRGRKQAGLESWELAEGALRECLEGRKLVKPEHWQTFDAMSLLGAVMLGQEQFDEAEQLLVEGYLGLDDREASIPAKRKGRMIESIQRLIEFYEAVEDETEVASWQSTLKLAKSK